MITNVIDRKVKTELDAHAKSCKPHRIATYMRNAVTGYGECQNIGCTATYHVGYDVRNPGRIAITDDSASGKPCPNTLG